MKLKLGILALMLIAAACGGDDADDVTQVTDTPETAATEAPVAETATTSPPAEVAGDVVTVSTTSAGEIVTDGEGNALYLFLPDAQGASVCYEDCAAAWPPLVVDVTAGDGVDGALLGTVARDDGTTQVTYNGWPLYYFASDAAPGDTNGQGLNDVWFVLSASGEGIGMPAVEAAPAGATVAVASSALGDILVDGDGNTLYLFVPDAQNASTCYDGCAEAWPPLFDEVSAGDGVDAALLGSTERDGGTTQATYNGWPLYYFASDAAAGDTNGQGANDVWYVVNAAGDAVTG